MQTLQELVSGIDNIESSTGDLSIDVTGIRYDSRKVEPGNIFVAIVGYKTDGHNYIKNALDRGAAAVVVQKDVTLPGNVPVIKVSDTRKALSLLGARFYGYPDSKFTLVGVTGTNGKTTTTHLLEAIFKETGAKVGLIGTISNRIGDKVIPVTNTTPESLDLQSLFADMAREDIKYVVMEVSSHALELDRVYGCEFDYAVFTNITQDHLDFHSTMENYLKAKSKLFSSLGGRRAKNPVKYGIINIDDPQSEYIIKVTNGKVITYGIRNKADVTAENIYLTPSWCKFDVVTKENRWPLKMKITGMFNVYNTLAAFSVALAEGLPVETVTGALEKVKGVPGRLEIVDEGQDFTVVVDYAHTPDSLENILKTAREFAVGRIITVFGCGGDRDKTKRPLMGEVSARLSDFSVITSDNPRTEDPGVIIEQIVEGTKKIVGPDRYMVVPDRREAIKKALEMARKDDLVVIAGKGHETYQIIGDRVLPFDDREVAREFLKR